MRPISRHNGCRSLDNEETYVARDQYNALSAKGFPISNASGLDLDVRNADDDVLPGALVLEMTRDNGRESDDDVPRARYHACTSMASYLIECGRMGTDAIGASAPEPLPPLFLEDDVADGVLRPAHGTLDLAKRLIGVQRTNGNIRLGHPALPKERGPCHSD